MKRVDSLDYLRGLMALSVMLYHYSSHLLGEVDGGSLLGKLGVYAVSMFYVLSGLSLTIVYQNKINSINDIYAFSIKRVFRIFPLFWLVISIAIITKHYSGIEYSWPYIFLNYSLLFGFVKPTAYVTEGAWSIGNEMVFYLFFSIIFFVSSVRFPKVVPFTLIISIAIGMYFGFVILDETQSLSEQWAIYINPFNQLFLFFGGVVIGYYMPLMKSIFPPKTGLIFIFISFFAFILYPSHGEQIYIVTGVDRLILSFLCFTFIFGLYFENPKFKTLPSKILRFLGECSYSIYLLHPLVGAFLLLIVDRFELGVEKSLMYAIAVFLTFFVSWVTFKYVEKPMMGYGKVLANKVESNAG